MTEPSPPEPPQAPGLLASVREALRGSGQDYTDGPLGRAILLLAIPMVLEMVMESLFAVVDVFFVSRLGAAAVATVGLTESLLTLIYTAAMGLSIGVMAMVSRRTGEKDPERAATTAVQAIALGIGVAALIGIPGAAFAPNLLRMMGATPDVVSTGSTFTAIMLGGNVVIMLLFLINAIFRGAGDAAIAMRVLWLSNGLNIILDPCFIFGLGPFPELGVTGAAVATTIGRGTGVLYQFYALARQSDRIRIRRRHLSLSPATMAQLIRLSGSGTFQVMVGMASWVGLVRILAAFGSNALAGYTIAIRVIVFALLPAWGLANAAATMVGQNLGARRPDRAEASVWMAGRYNLVFLGLMGACFFLFAPTITGLFTADPEVMAHAIAGLRIVSLGFPFYAYGMVLTQSFNGAGDTWTPTWINLACFWGWELPLAWALAIHFRLGPNGVFIAMAAAFSTLAVVSGFIFRLGRWKSHAV